MTTDALRWWRAGAPRRWPFTDEEAAAIRAAYEALTRVGNAGRDDAAHGTDTGGWDPILDDAHQKLGVLLAMGRLDE